MSIWTLTGINRNKELSLYTIKDILNKKNRNPMGWPDELSVCFQFWKILDFEPMGSNLGQVQPMT